jgi:hypothetical protein
MDMSMLPCSQLGLLVCIQQRRLTLEEEEDEAWEKEQERKADEDYRFHVVIPIVMSVVVAVFLGVVIGVLLWVRAHRRAQREAAEEAKQKQVVKRGRVASASTQNHSVVEMMGLSKIFDIFGSSTEGGESTSPEIPNYLQLVLSSNTPNPAMNMEIDVNKDLRFLEDEPVGKVMFTGLEIDIEVLKVFKMEVKVLTRCCHPNIISIYGAYSTSSSLGIVEELAQCSLHDLIHPTDESTALMPLHQVRVFFRKF